MPIQQEKKQETAKGQIGGIELRLGVVTDTISIPTPDNLDIFDFRRINLNVQMDGGTWMRFDQVPMVDWDFYSGGQRVSIPGTDITVKIGAPFLKTKPINGTFCIVAFLDKSHTSANAIILGFFDPTFTVQEIDKDHVTKSATGAKNLTRI